MGKVVQFQPDEIIGPAKLADGHIRDRLLGSGAGAKRAWRNTTEHPLASAFHQGKIDREQYQAGDTFRELFEKIGRSGRDSTELVVIGGSSGVPFTQEQVDAVRMIERIELNLVRFNAVDGSKYRVAARKFCGEGWSMADAVKDAGFPDARKTGEHMRRTLDKLALAIMRSRATTS